MRSVDALFLGLFSVAATIAAGCSGPESVTSPAGPSSGSASGAGGAAGGGGTGGSPIPIDGYKECTEYCVKRAELCTGLTPEQCLTGQCEEWKKDVGPECQDEFDVYFACLNAWMHSLSPGDPDACLWFSGDCHPARVTLSDCQQQYGCVPADGCWQQPAPNGGTGCYCRAMCQQRELNSLCWTEGGGGGGGAGGTGGQGGGGKQVCDCTIDGVSVGMCEQQPELVCWAAVFYDPCCMQYFMIP